MSTRINSSFTYDSLEKEKKKIFLYLRISFFCFFPGPTQKLRRPHVMKMYKETVDEFYNV